jgi:hypothetical protein
MQTFIAVEARRSGVLEFGVTLAPSGLEALLICIRNEQF